jgi:glycine/D-amino acid oxidase-like deaminating enzyme
MDLLSSRPFWPVRDGLPATFPPLSENTDCDVAIIGGGISGALLAWHLAEAKFDVLLLDRRDVAHGSTAGNTGLILYEIDEPLHRLARRFGAAPAARAYQRCFAAVAALEKLVRRLRLQCEFERKASLYVAATPAHVSALECEFAARRAAGLEVEWWPRRRIVNSSTLPHRAAICSPAAAQVDAYRLTYGLLLAAQRRGVRIHDRTEVTRRRFLRHGVELSTARGFRVRARQLIVAAGYESETFLPECVGALQSTYAVISEPVAEFPGWPADRCLIWDTADPYLYLRTTADNRAIIGGLDARFRAPLARDRLLPAKTRKLQRQFRTFFPRIPFEVDTAWAGTFGTTRDGLPYIGRHREVPHTWFALGFGGNGTVFSLIAAEIIRAALLGDSDPDAELFGFER